SRSSSPRPFSCAPHCSASWRCRTSTLADVSCAMRSASTMRAAATLLLLGTLVAGAAADEATSVYDHACAWCHGKDGRGDGPAAFSIGKYRAPRPRDFTRGRFELRSTASGELPTDEDLLRTLERGIPGAMPSFRGLTAGERRLAITAIKRFYPAFATAHPTTVPVPAPPTLDAAAVARRREA